MYGNPVAGGNNATPSFTQRFGTIQDVSVDFSQKLEKLMGQSKAPDDIAASDMEFKGTAAFAKIEVDIYNSLFFGDSVVTGSKNFVDAEVHTAAAANFVATNNNTFVQNLGLRYATTGATLEQVTAGNEATGKYSCNNATGTYTLGGNDASNNVVFLVSYIYTTPSGKTLTVMNHLQGYGPVFELYLSQSYQNPGNGLHLYRCKASKMGAPMKRAGYMISAFEFEAFANPAGQIMDIFQVS